LSAAVALLAISTPAVAVAHEKNVTPPGNSAVIQYVESVPTANGSRPSGTFHQKSAGAVVGKGGSGGSGGSGGANGSTIPTATARGLGHQGPNGRAAEALASATAPTAARGVRTAAGNVPQSGGGSGSPLSGVLAAFTGSSAQGGLGALLPVILVLVAFGSGALALWRRRRSA
jgi:hypothetical protein